MNSTWLNGEELQMVDTSSTKIFPLEILKYLSRRFIYLETFLVGRAKIVLVTIWVLAEISGIFW